MARLTASCSLAAALSLALPAMPSPAGQQPTAQSRLRPPDVIFLPTPPEVVAAMLTAARVGKGDVVYDLGSGDGRIVISAVKDFGAARGVGIDIDPERVAEASANARQSGVADRVTFLNQDLFTTDFTEATVVTLYLLPSLNLRLRPKLMSDLRPGTRIVSHAFDIGDWVPEQTLHVAGRTVYYWTIPTR
jgi:trans-aconitate methyltransferase